MSDSMAVSSSEGMAAVVSFRLQRQAKLLKVLTNSAGFIDRTVWGGGLINFTLVALSKEVIGSAPKPQR